MSARCADAAADDPLVATAPPARRWFLVEHPGPWAPQAPAGVFAPDVARALVAHARARDGRVVLVRRPGRQAAEGPRRWFAVDARPGHESVRTGTVAGDDALVAALADPAAGAPHPGPLFLVCVHGRHDPCCAVRGRRLAAALAAAHPAATWECSHLGGCRFAAAMVALPHGFTFGRMEPPDGLAAAAAYTAGRVDARFLRGRSALPPAAQAAQHHAREALRADGVDTLRPVRLTGGDGRWRAELATPDCVVELRESWEATGRPLTCAATRPGGQRRFVALRVDPAVAGLNAPVPPAPPASG